jgi:uncharacterized protein
MSPIKRWLKYLKTIKRASKKGAFFPQYKSSTIHAAPQGTAEIPTAGSALRRLIQEVGWFRISEHHIEINTLKSPVRILHITDVHLRDSDDWLQRLCQCMNGLEADIVVITGDLITRGWTREALDLFFQACPRGRLGTYAIMGNWEYWSGQSPATWREVLSNYDVLLLCEESHQTPLVNIYGTDDHMAGQSDPERLEKALCDDIPNIVLTHSPAFFPKLTHPAVSLVLAGHAHGGQIRIPKLGALWTPKGTDQYIAGWFKQDNTHLFVSRGVGWSVAPLRLLCPPELAFIHCTPNAGARN